MRKLQQIADAINEIIRVLNDHHEVSIDLCNYRRSKCRFKLKDVTIERIQRKCYFSFEKIELFLNEYFHIIQHLCFVQIIGPYTDNYVPESSRYYEDCEDNWDRVHLERTEANKSYVLNYMNKYRQLNLFID